MSTKWRVLPVLSRLVRPGGLQCLREGKAAQQNQNVQSGFVSQEWHGGLKLNLVGTRTLTRSREDQSMYKYRG